MIWGGFFDLPGKKDIVARLEQESAQPNFWDNASKARHLMRDLNAAKDALKTWSELTQTLQDLSAHLELAEEAKDEAEEKEVAKGLETLRARLNDLEIKALLNGPHDSADAIMTMGATIISESERVVDEGLLQEDEHVPPAHMPPREIPGRAHWMGDNYTTPPG